MLDADKIREDFPIFSRTINGKRLVYLDSAATSQKPIHVIDAIAEYYSNSNANVHRGIHHLSREATQKFDYAREKVANFINASPEEIVFVRNATEALNLLRYSLFSGSRKKKKTRIITSILEHHSNLVPWLALKMEKKASLSIVDICSDYTLNQEMLTEFISNYQNEGGILSITACSNVTGTITNIDKICKEANECGFFTILDACQSVPHQKTDVKKTNCDALVFSGHKMLGPMGIGVLYCKKEKLEDMEPFLYGGDMIKEVHLNEVSYALPPQRFEAGTPDVANAVGLAAAIEYLEKIGMEKIVEHEKKLIDYFFKQLEDYEDIIHYGPSSISQKASVFAFNIFLSEREKIHSHDVAEILDSEGIAVRSGHHCAQPLLERIGITDCVRASCYIYNTKEDIDKMFEALNKVKTVFS